MGSGNVLTHNSVLKWKRSMRRIQKCQRSRQQRLFLFCYSCTSRTSLYTRTDEEWNKIHPDRRLSWEPVKDIFNWFTSSTGNCKQWKENVNHTHDTCGPVPAGKWPSCFWRVSSVEQMIAISKKVWKHRCSLEARLYHYGCRTESNKKPGLLSQL